MPKRIVPTFTQLKLLEEFTTYAYESFKRAFESTGLLEVSWASALYHNTLHHCLGVVTEDEPYLGPNSNRIPVLNRFILQHILADSSLGSLELRVQLLHIGAEEDIPQPQKSSITIEQLKTALADNKITYYQIGRMSDELARAYEFEIAREGMEFVRKHFKFSFST